MNVRRQAKFLYRYLTSAHRWRKWRNPQALIVVMACSVFLAGFFWTPFSAQGVDPTATPVITLTTPAPAVPTRTPFPPEFAGNSEQTIGITFAGAILVLIVVIGVIAYLPQRTDR